MNFFRTVRKATKYFPNAGRHTRAIQAHRYAMALLFLGDKWILANPREKHVSK